MNDSVCVAKIEHTPSRLAQESRVAILFFGGRAFCFNVFCASLDLAADFSLRP
jgi:hypothetical protein